MSKFLDDNFDKKLVENLERIGLSEKEVSVYLFLLGKQNEVGSSKIIQATNLHGQYVYNSLSLLEKRGLVKHVVKNGRKKFSANPPQRLLSLVEEKKMLVNESIDSLGAIFSNIKKQEFEVFQGREQFVIHEISLVKNAEEGDFIDILAGRGDKFRELLGEDREYYNKLSLNKKLKIRFIGAADQEDYLKNTKNNRPYFDYKIMPNLKNSSVSTSIRKDGVVFQIYGEPVLSFSLKSIEIAKDYKNFFESLWDMCPA